MVKIIKLIGMERKEIQCKARLKLRSSVAMCDGRKVLQI